MGKKRRAAVGRLESGPPASQGLGRRRFLKHAGGGALVAGLWPLLSRCGGDSSGGDRGKFSFAVISDLHILSDEGAYQNKVLSMTAEVLNAHDPPLDFVVSTGDNVDELPSDDPAFYEASSNTALDRFIALRSEFAMPFHLIMGNHDYYTATKLIPTPTTQKEARERLYRERLGMPDPYYVLEHRGVKLYFLNSMQQDPEVRWEPNAVGTLGPAQISWLRDELRDRKPAFFFHHHALATEVTTSAGVSSFIPFEIPRADGHFGKYQWLKVRDYTDPIYDVLETHRKQVKATFFGHSHLFLRDHFDGIPIFMTNSMRLPCVSQYEGKPMRYHIVECEAGTGNFTIANEYMIPYVKDQQGLTLEEIEAYRKTLPGI